MEPGGPGEYITGEVLSFQTNVGEYDSDLMTIDTGDGEIGVWIKSVLKSNIKRNEYQARGPDRDKYAGKRKTIKEAVATRITGSRSWNGPKKIKKRPKMKRLSPFKASAV